MISPPFVCPQKLPESPIPRAVSLCMYCLWVHTLRGCAEVCMLGALWAPLQGRPTATYLRAHRRRGRHLSIMGALTATDMTRGLFPLHKTTTLFLSGSKDDMCQQDVHGRASRRNEPNWPVALQRGRQSVRLTGHIPGAGEGAQPDEK